jgi:hypothetical protein
VSVLDRSMIVYGSSIADGHEHEEEDLPVLLAGGGNGTIKTGHYLKPRHNTSMSRLHLAMMQRMEIPAGRFAEAQDALEL